MFENGPAVDLALGRSTVRQRILALLIAEPGLRLHLREIQRRAQTSPGTASRELARLVAAGMVEREAEGNQVYFRGSTTPLAAMLRSLLIAAPPVAPVSSTRGRRSMRIRQSGTSVGSPASGGATGTQEADRASSGTAGTAAASMGRNDGMRGTDPAISSAAAVSSEAAVAEAVAVEAAAASEATSRELPPQLAAAASDEGEVEPSPAPRVYRSATATPAPGQLTFADATDRAGGADPLGLEAGRSVAEQLWPMLGERLRGVYLFGERATAGAAPDSDVELLVVLDRIEEYGAELERTSSICASLSLQHGVIVSRVFVSEAEWRDRADGRLPAVRTQAVPL